jgi:outer membrane lipoprotein SlyB
MIVRALLVGLAGAAIGGVLGWTIAEFTGWNPAIAIVAIVFGVLAVWGGERRGRAPAVDGLERPTRDGPSSPDEKR